MISQCSKRTMDVAVVTTHSSSDVEGNWDSDGAQRDGKLSSILQVAWELVCDAIIFEWCLVRLSAAAEAITVVRYWLTATKGVWTWGSNFIFCAFSGNSWAWPVFGITEVNFDSFRSNWRLGCLSLFWDTGLQSFWVGVCWWAVESNNNWAVDCKTDFSGAFIDDIDEFECLFLFVSGSWFSSCSIEEFALC
jgi:hypothetical protein